MWAEGLGCRMYFDCSMGQFFEAVRKASRVTLCICKLVGLGVGLHDVLEGYVFRLWLCRYIAEGLEHPSVIA